MVIFFPDADENPLKPSPPLSNNLLEAVDDPKFRSLVGLEKPMIGDKLGSSTSGSFILPIRGGKSHGENYLHNKRNTSINLSENSDF